MENIKNLNLVVDEPKYFFNGKPVPRVTNILGSILDKSYLIGWANYLGLKNMNYEKVLNQAAEYGTLTHNQIEKFLLKDEQIKGTIAYQSFLKWYNIVSAKNTIQVILSEQELVCEYYGGTLDAVMSINGKNYIIDFKTSNNINYDYFIQLAAYYKLLNSCGFNLDIKGIIVLQLDKKVIKFTEYILDLTNAIHVEYLNDCIKTFDSMVESYYMINDIKNRYTDIV